MRRAIKVQHAPLTAAEAWCWVSWMHSRESDASAYSYPRTEADTLRAEVKREQADAAYARAVQLDPDDSLWQRAIAKWESPGLRKDHEP